MKLRFFCSIALIVFHCSLPMDFESVSFDDSDSSDNSQEQHTPDNNIIDAIDEAIKQKWSSSFDSILIYSWFHSLFSLPHDKAHDIIHTEKERIPQMKHHDIEILRQKNTVFNNAIHFFIGEAEKNIDMVTVSHLLALMNYKAMQQSGRLNNIPLPIKKYCMKSALQKKNPFDPALHPKEAKKNFHKLYLCGKIIEKSSDEVIENELRPLLPKLKFAQKEIDTIETKIANNRSKRIEMNILYSINT